MKLVTCRGDKGLDRLGVLTPDGSRLVDLPAEVTTNPTFASMQTLIEGGPEALARLLEVSRRADLPSRELTGVQLAAPLPAPRKNIFCVGLNYLDHIKEGDFDKGAPPRPDPEFFTKPRTSVSGPFDDILLHADATKKLDYEVELAVVIGSAGRDIKEEDWECHIFGYTIINDVTGRDLQFENTQWFKGKSLDGSCPMGPFIATRDEIADPHALRLKTVVNGEVRQDASTASMLYRLPKIVSFLSRGLTLEPGDVIATGTPSGIGYTMKPPRALASGDLVELSIDGLGAQRCRIT